MLITVKEKEKKNLERGIELTRVTALAENEQVFSLFHTDCLRTQDLSPKFSLQQIITKCPMLLWFRYRKTSEPVTVAEKTKID